MLRSAAGNTIVEGLASRLLADLLMSAATKKRSTSVHSRADSVITCTDQQWLKRIDLVLLGDKKYISLTLAE